MPSKAVAGGIYSDILGEAGIVKKATFVPVTTGAPPAGAIGAMSGAAKP
ncbi:hypothetical protein ABZ738_30190 [Micromonospora sp. NPDC047793]